MKSCPECDSENIIYNAKAVDRGDYNADAGFTVAIDEYPDALIFKQTVNSKVKINICAECGYIRFYAVELEKLIAVNQNRRTSDEQ